MKKAELIRSTAETSGIPASTVRVVVDALADAALVALSKGEEVYLAGLGKLVVAQRGPKAARNLRTGEKLVVPPRKVVVYRPSLGANAAANAA